MLSGDAGRPAAARQAKLVTSGFVRVNGRRVDSAAKPVAVGDVITLALSRTTAVVRIDDIGARRGPAPEARALYSHVSRGEGALVSDDGTG